MSTPHPSSSKYAAFQNAPPHTPDQIPSLSRVLETVVLLRKNPGDSFGFQLDEMDTGKLIVSAVQGISQGLLKPRDEILAVNGRPVQGTIVRLGGCSGFHFIIHPMVQLTLSSPHRQLLLEMHYHTSSKYAHARAYSRCLHNQ